MKISNGYHIELSMNYILLWLAQLVLTALNHVCIALATEAEEHLTGMCCVMEFKIFGKSRCTTCKQTAVKLFFQQVSLLKTIFLFPDNDQNLSFSKGTR